MDLGSGKVKEAGVHRGKIPERRDLQRERTLEICKGFRQVSS